MDKLEKVFRQLRSEADEILFADLDFDARLKEKVRQGLKSRDITANLPSNDWQVRAKWNFGVVAATVLLGLLVSTTPALKNYLHQGANKKLDDNTVSQSSPPGPGVEKGQENGHSKLRRGPAPIPFANPIEVVAESYPVHPNQTFTIQPKGKDWSGKSVKLYYVPLTGANEDELLYKKVLPINAQNIGSAAIDHGKWTFQWQASSQFPPKGYDRVLLAAQSDDGTLSATLLYVNRYDKLEVVPSTVKIGQKVELRGAGFPASDIKVRISKHSDESTLLQADIGSFHTDDGSFNYVFEVTPKIDGNQISPGMYQVFIVYDFPGTAGQIVSVNLNIE